MNCDKLKEIMVRAELSEDNLIDFLLAGCVHMGKISLIELRDHESCRHFMEVVKIINEVRHEQS